MIEFLEMKRTEIQDRVKEIIMQVQDEDREFTDGELDEIEDLEDKFKKIEREMQAVARAEERERERTRHIYASRKSDPDDVVREGATMKTKYRFSMPSSKGTHDFKSFGQFSLAVRNAQTPGGSVDPRLLKGSGTAPTQTSTEGVGADGGYLVPPDYRTSIVDQVMGEDTLLGRTNQIITASNQVIVPADETTPWQTTGGVQVYWESEAGEKTQSKIALKQKTLRLSKLISLVPVSDELLQDAASLDSYLRRTVGEKMNFAINLALVQGSGVGEPLGILNCGCKIAVDAESGQAADTVVSENIVNMWSRMYGPYRANAVWLINQDIEPQLYTLSWEGASSSVPLWLPGNNLAGQPYSTLLGKPIIPTQACETLGDEGDIILASFDAYLSALKATGIEEEISIHLWFDFDVTAFRFVFRIGGQCLLSSAISGRDTGTSTMSPFITLAARA